MTQRKTNFMDFIRETPPKPSVMPAVPVPLPAPGTTTWQAAVNAQAKGQRGMAAAPLPVGRKDALDVWRWAIDPKRGS
jgi:hypothetical protein